MAAAPRCALPLLLLLPLLLALANTEGSCALPLASRHSPRFVLSACGAPFLLLLPPSCLRLPFHFRPSRAGLVEAARVLVQTHSTPISSDRFAAKLCSHAYACHVEMLIARCRASGGQLN
jgi:hypothetical protein